MATAFLFGLGCRRKPSRALVTRSLCDARLSCPAQAPRHFLTWLAKQGLPARTFSRPSKPRHKACSSAIAFIAATALLLLANRPYRFGSWPKNRSSVVVSSGCSTPFLLAKRHAQTSSLLRSWWLCAGISRFTSAASCSSAAGSPALAARAGRAGGGRGGGAGAGGGAPREC